ncbi:ATP-grasp domain-containing protein [Ornithinimicrobium sp. Y1847]|uniref:hypothetical protein n=1 Tax=unclassified Ornithinimicrobium TaxID=2615080 RepID=UPI003B6740A1
MVNAAFVAPFLLPATTRFVLAAARVPGVRLGVITASPADHLPAVLREQGVAHWQVKDPLDPQQLTDGVRGLSHTMGGVDRLIGILEQLQVPLAQVRDALDIPGMREDAARNVRDKSRMKTVLREAGLPCARHQLVHHTDQARAFVDQVGLPLVAKPPDGAGAKATFRLDTEQDFESWLQVAQRDPGEPWLLEEFLTGREHTFDAVTLGGETLWASISDYHPTPLEVLRHPWMQWSVLLPQDISGPEYDQIRTVGPAALSALGVENALSHMEWFARPDGSVAISEVGARPPGAQIAAMIGHAHGFDFFDVYSRLVLLDEFELRERTHAVGTAYLRGMGRGRVRHVSGVEEVNRDIGHLVVDARLPQAGQPASSGYEGEGYVTVKHEDTAVVAAALDRIVSGLRVELIETD